MGRLPQNIFSIGRPDDEVVVYLPLSDTATIYYSTDIPRWDSVLSFSGNLQATISSSVIYTPRFASTYGNAVSVLLAEH